MELNEKRKSEPLCRVRDIYRLINNFEGALQKKIGVGLNEGMLLCSLSTLGECASGRVAELLGLSLSNASKVILSAEKKGLIERIIGKEDKRQMLFALTQEGKDCIDKIKTGSGDILELIEKVRGI